MSASSLTDFFLYVCGNKIGPLKQILALQIFILAVSLGICARDGHCACFRVDCCTGADIRDMSGILIRVFSSCLTTYYLFLLLPPPSQPSTLSLKARHTTAFWWPLYSLLISPVSTHHRRARLSEEAVE